MENFGTGDYPEVSVIVPNYNHAKYLDLRLQSILSQTYPNLSIIFLDDASTDESLRVFEKYAGDSRVRCIVNEVNSGSTFKQWNKGASYAQGKYLWIAESDDYAEPTFLEKTVPLLERYSSLGLVYTESIMVDEEGNEFGLAREEIWRSDPQRWMSSFMNNGIDEIKNHLCYENTIPNASATLMRRSVFEKVGGARDTLRLHGDYVLWFDILRQSDIAFLAEPLNYFRFSIGSVRRKLQAGGLDIEERYRIAKYMFERIDFDMKVRERICFYLARLWLRPERILTPISRQLKIAKVAAEVDPKLAFHILKRSFTGPFKFIYMLAYGMRKRKQKLRSRFRE